MMSRWYLDLAGAPVTLTLTSDLDGRQRLTGSATDGNGATDIVDNVTWDATTGVLDFRRHGGRRRSGCTAARRRRRAHRSRIGQQWARRRAPPRTLDAYNGHVVGWNERYFSERHRAARLRRRRSTASVARLRLDRDATQRRHRRAASRSTPTRSTATPPRRSSTTSTCRAGTDNNLTFVRSGQRCSRRPSAASSTANKLLGMMTVDGDGRAEDVRRHPRRAASAYGLVAARHRHARRLADAHAPPARAPHDGRQPGPADAVGRSPSRPIVSSTAAATATSRPIATTTPSTDRRLHRRRAAALRRRLPNPYGEPALTREMHGYSTTPPGDAPSRRAGRRSWCSTAIPAAPRDSRSLRLGLLVRRRAGRDAATSCSTLDIGHRPLADRRAAL